MRILCVIALATCLCSRQASAQLCTGSASFADGPFQASVAAAFTESAKGFGAGLAYGGRTPFGSISIGTTSYDDIDGSSFTVGAGGGYQFAANSKGTVHVCPTFDIGFAEGPNDVDIFGDGTRYIDLSEFTFAFGVSLGVVAGKSSRTTIVPHASLDLVNSSLEVDNAVGSTPQSRTETFGLLGLGLGIIVNRLTLQPGVGIPLGLEGSSVSFGIAASLNFGAARQ